MGELSGALECVPMSCDALPAGAVSDSASPVYGDTATLTCEEGFYFGEVGTRSGTITCNVVGTSTVGWSEGSCTALTCDVKVADFDNAVAMQDTSATLEVGGTTVVMCGSGFATDPSDESTNMLDIACVDEGAVGVAKAQGSCQELSCPAIDTIKGSQTIAVTGAGCDASTAMSAESAPCAFECTKGTAVNEKFNYVTCSKGVLEMCEDAQCSETYGLAGGPACVGAEQKVKEANVVKSSATLTFESRRLSSARLLSTAAAQLEAKIDAVLAAFREAMAATLSVDLSKVVIESHTLSGLTLTVNFYVEVEAGSSLESTLMASLEEISTGGGLATTLMSELGEALADVEGLDVTVGAVSVSAPQKGTIFVVEESSSSSGGSSAEEEEGGGNMGMIIGIVVVVVLLGGAFVFVKMKK